MTGRPLLPEKASPAEIFFTQILTACRLTPSSRATSIRDFSPARICFTATSFLAVLGRRPWASVSLFEQKVTKLLLNWVSIQEVQNQFFLLVSDRLEG